MCGGEVAGPFALAECADLPTMPEAGQLYRTAVMATGAGGTTRRTPKIT
eukprot:COSAG01_NODE_6059_length_3875_cov_286.205244_6_plen_48_part_01